MSWGNGPECTRGAEDCQRISNANNGLWVNALQVSAIYFFWFYFEVCKAKPVLISRTKFSGVTHLSSPSHLFLRRNQS
jgi:hypothetical protein